VARLLTGARRPGGDPHARAGLRAGFFLETLILTLLLFGAALLVHEGGHLAAIHAVGGEGVLIVRPWRLSFLGGQIYGLHAQPLTPLNPMQQLLVNLGGPLLAAVPIALLLRLARRPAARIALGLNLGVLLFYAVIEALYVVLESGFGLEGEWLTAAELNYGLPALVTLAVLALAATSPEIGQLRAWVVRRQPPGSRLP
jgi:hypothetical protein